MKCSYGSGEDWRKISNGVLFLGVDVGRCRDLTVFWLLEKLGDTLYTRDVKAMRDVSFAEQESVLYSYMQNPSLRRACIDKTGIGRQFAERAQERFGSSRVEGISFTAAVKEELAANEPSVIISRRPCALLKTVKAKPALVVDADKCKACKACSRIGCPAITKKDGKAYIDSTLCVGCGVCTQLCAFDAIVGGDAE